jgi:hypothetical protein
VPPFDPTLSQLAMIPLFEPIRPDFPVYPQAYPGNIDGETPHTAMSFQITSAVMQADARDYVTVHTVVGESGQGIVYLKKGATEVVMGQATQGRAYAATLFEAQAITRLAAAAGKTYGIGAITLIHGESDAGSATYEADMFQLWSDYNADLPGITGQTASIPMFVSQQNSVPTNLSSSSAATIAQWKIGVDHPGDIVCIGPKYQYPYLQDTSGYIHLSAAGYELLGEKYGQVYYERVIAGHDWQPLQPDPARPPEVSGQQITIHFHVPVPPLQWDESFPQPHVAIPEWAIGRGFEVRAASNPVTITAVDIVGDDAVKITVQNDLSGLQVQVGYALSTEGTTTMRTQGHSTFRWGQLMDSDPFVGAFTSTPQPNYCLTFQMNVQ